MPRSFVVIAVALASAAGCRYDEKGVGGAYTTGELSTLHGCTPAGTTGPRAILAGQQLGIELSVHLSDGTALEGHPVRLVVEVQSGQDWVADPTLLIPPLAPDTVGGASSAIVSAPATAGEFRIRGFTTPPGHDELELQGLDCTAVATPAESVAFLARSLESGQALALTTGDVDDDGQVDLVAISNDDTNNLRLWLGGPDLLTETPWTLTLGGTPSHVAVGNFAGDRSLLIGAARAGTNDPELELLGLNAASSGLESVTTHVLAAAPSALVSADYDGDADAALIAAEPTASEGSLELLDLRSPELVAHGGLADATALAVGRFDADTLDDVAATGPNGKLIVYLGQATLLSSPAAIEVTLSGPATCVTFADTDSDGLVDVVVGLASGAVVVLRQGPVSSGLPTLVAQTPVTLTGVPASLGAGDFNGDGRQDLAVASVDALGGWLTALVNTATGLVLAPSIAIPGTPRSLAVDDLDGDGRRDVAIASYGQPLTILLGR